jgi:hypothetical protein
MPFVQHVIVLFEDPAVIMSWRAGRMETLQKHYRHSIEIQIEIMRFEEDESPCVPQSL